MDVIFVNSKNSKTSEAQRLLLNLLDNINVKEKINIFLCQILTNTIHRNM